MPDPSDPSDPSAELRRPWWALVVVAVALVAAVWLMVAASGGDGVALLDEDPAMLAVAPGGTIAFDELPEDHQVLYQAARDHEEAFSQARCYCGCEAMLGHEDLFRCFVTAAGEWERHGTGCAVCLAQAQDMRDGLEAGLPVSDIVEQMDRRYGAINPTS